MGCKHQALGHRHKKYIWKQHFSRNHNKKAHETVQRRRNEKQIHPKGKESLFKHKGKEAKAKI